MGTQRLLSIRLFGRFEARLGDEPIRQLRIREGERLLAYLTFNHCRDVSKHAIANVFWPETGSLDSVRQALSSLRKALGEESGRLEASKGFVRLDLSGVDVDLFRFQEVLATEDARRILVALETVDPALLSGWGDGWVEEERRRLLRRQISAFKSAAAAAMEAGAFGDAVPILRRLNRALPAERQWWSDLMTALVRSGELVEARQVFERCREYLAKHNLTPLPEMNALHEDLRANVVRTNGAGNSAGTVSIAEPIGGAVPLNSRFYVVRKEDARFTEALLRSDSLVLVKGHRQTGKSSLLARGLHEARRANACVLFSDIETFGNAALNTMESLCLHLATSLREQMEMMDIALQPLDWRPSLPPNLNLERFLLRQALGGVSNPVVWALDEVDRIFERPYSQEFFAMLRSWHEKRSFDPARPWHRLTVALACATEAHLFIRNLDQSPFNVGTHLLLGGFTQEQVEDLNDRYGSPFEESEVPSFYALTGGHPYLVRRGLYEAANRRLSFKELVHECDAEHGLYGGHLSRLGRMIAGDTELHAAVVSVLNGDSPGDESSFLRLRSAGVLTGPDAAGASMRCLLYASFFKRRLKGG